MRTRVPQYASQPRLLICSFAIVDNRDESRPEVVVADGHPAALLVATFGVFFGVLGHADHLGDTHGVETTEGLGYKLVYRSQKV